MGGITEIRIVSGRYKILLKKTLITSVYSKKIVGQDLNTADCNLLR